MAVCECNPISYTIHRMKQGTGIQQSSDIVTHTNAFDCRSQFFMGSIDNFINVLFDSDTIILLLGSEIIRTTFSTEGA